MRNRKRRNLSFYGRKSLGCVAMPKMEIICRFWNDSIAMNFDMKKYSMNLTFFSCRLPVQRCSFIVSFISRRRAFTIKYAQSHTIDNWFMFWYSFSFVFSLTLMFMFSLTLSLRMHRMDVAHCVTWNVDIVRTEKLENWVILEWIFGLIHGVTNIFLIARMQRVHQAQIIQISKRDRRTVLIHRIPIAWFFVGFRFSGLLKLKLCRWARNKGGISRTKLFIDFIEETSPTNTGY